MCNYLCSDTGKRYNILCFEHCGVLMYSPKAAWTRNSAFSVLLLLFSPSALLSTVSILTVTIYKTNKDSKQAGRTAKEKNNHPLLPSNQPGFNNLECLISHQRSVQSAGRYAT